MWARNKVAVTRPGFTATLLCNLKMIYVSLKMNKRRCEAHGSHYGNQRGGDATQHHGVLIITQAVK